MKNPNGISVISPNGRNLVATCFTSPSTALLALSDTITIQYHHQNHHHHHHHFVPRHSNLASIKLPVVPSRFRNGTGATGTDATGATCATGEAMGVFLAVQVGHLPSQT